MLLLLLLLLHILRSEMEAHARGLALLHLRRKRVCKIKPASEIIKSTRTDRRRRDQPLREVFSASMKLLPPINPTLAFQLNPAGAANRLISVKTDIRGTQASGASPPRKD